MALALDPNPSPLGGVECRFPRTRYLGSKRRFAHAIVNHVRGLSFRTVLDAFGGTGAVSYAFKRLGKSVTYNDVLAFNHQIGLALIENDCVRLPSDVLHRIGIRQPDVPHDDFIRRTFSETYFTDAENKWLDIAVSNLHASFDCVYQRALAWFALFQSALAKRPYNLFHRKNLYMRTANVERSFGNKSSWDRSFAAHFRVFAAEANSAVFDSGGTCRAINRDVLGVEPSYDLVYLDPPYVSRSGSGVDYRDFYHFLEGMVDYAQWPAHVDYQSKHRRLVRRPDAYSDARLNRDRLMRVLEHFRRSILVVSYRSDGHPSIEDLAGMMRRVKRRVRALHVVSHQYALSKNRNSREHLIIGTD